jgi:hypothetical protein
MKTYIHILSIPRLVPIIQLDISSDRTLTTGRTQLVTLHTHLAIRRDVLKGGLRLRVICFTRLRTATNSCSVSNVTGHVCISVTVLFYNINVSLGQGCKVCPFSDVEALKTEHVSASRNDILARLLCDREMRVAEGSPTRDIFTKTAALITALRNVGCRAPAQEETILSLGEHEVYNHLHEHQTKLRRGYIPKNDTCSGRLSLDYNNQGRPLIMYVYNPLFTRAKQ